MIILRNYTPSALPKGTDVAALTDGVTASFKVLLEESGLDPETSAALRIHLDWVQYKTSFRDPVMIRRAVDQQEQLLPLSEIAIDLRQMDPAKLTDQIRAAVRTLRDGAPADPDQGPFYLDTFKPWRDTIVWPFNRLFWQRLGEWEEYAHRGFEAALPSGGSDANHPQSVADSVQEFWTLLRDLDSHGQLPPDIYAMEIGVGSGARARLWLDEFKRFDDEKRTGYYAKLRFLLGDYSPSTLDTALEAVGPHAHACSVIPIDATNPFKTLSFLRFKIMFVHLTNVYDNLSFDELARRDGRLYIVEVRPYISRATVRHLEAEFGLAPDKIAGAMKRLLDFGPDAIGDHERGMVFWNCIWGAIRFEERLRAIDEGETAHLPNGVNRSPLDDLLADAPQEARFHLSRGAAESFVKTAALLHPRGYLHVQDIFVTEMKDYGQGFRGPGKLDGSFVIWVNGAFLRAVGAREGYDVHFRPFPYRKGSKTQTLYTVKRA